LTLFVRKNGREALQQQHIGSRAFSSEVGTGSREENAIKQRDRASDLIRSDRKML
jgi:hypothetical protein